MGNGDIPFSVIAPPAAVLHHVGLAHAEIVKVLILIPLGFQGFDVGFGVLHGGVGELCTVAGRGIHGTAGEIGQVGGPAVRVLFCGRYIEMFDEEAQANYII